MIRLRKLLMAGVPAVAAMMFNPTKVLAGAPAWPPPFSPPPSPVVQLSDKGVVPNRYTDQSTAINVALAALPSGTVALLAPGTYQVGHPILVPSGITLRGTQGNDGSPLSILEQSGSMGKWERLLLGVIMNKNYDATQITDSKISIEYLTIIDQSTGVLMRMARGITVSGVHFIGGGDGTAFLASADTSVTDCLAEGTINAAYDHWDGDTNASVTNSIARAANGYGILFNASDTDGAGRVASNFTATGNDISGSGKNQAGIWVAPLGAPGTSHIMGKIIITDNLVHSPQPSVPSGGVVIRTDSTTSIVVQRNHIMGFLGYSPLSVIQNPVGGVSPQASSHSITVTDNIIENNIVSPGNGGIVDIRGDQVVSRNNSSIKNQGEKGAVMPFYRPK